jgi:type I restriction enzyme M protein
MFNEVNELEDGEFDEENYEVFPSDELKKLKGDIKICNGDIREFKKEIKALKIRIKANEIFADLQESLAQKEKALVTTTVKKEAIETKLARHTELANELKTCRAYIATTKARKEDLVEKAREKITPEEAKALILERWRETLHATVMDYVNRYERELIGELENRYTKYCNTLTSILNSREASAQQLGHLLIELGYEG